MRIIQKCLTKVRGGRVKEGNLFQPYLCVGPFERGIIFIHLEVHFAGGDGQSPPGHQHRGNELGWAAQDHRACRGAPPRIISNA